MSLKNLAKKIKKETKDQSKTLEEQFLEVLDNHLISPKESKPKRLAFNPSGYYKCARMIYYKLKGLEGDEKVYPRSQRIFAVGTATHEWVQTIIQEVGGIEDSPLKLVPKEELPSFGVDGIEFISEHNSHPIEIKWLDRRWTKKFPISAMVDGSLEFNNKYMLFEFKTINTEDFNTLYEPLKDHIKQGAIYALSLGVITVIFVYIDKNDQNWKAFAITYTDDQLQWVKDRIQRIENHVLEDTLPDKEESDQCRWCGFKKMCEKDLTE